MKSMNRGYFTFIAILLIVAGSTALGWHAWNTIAPSAVPLFDTLGLRNTLPQSLPKLLDLRKEIFAPPPLRGPFGIDEGYLTITGVLEETNRHRSENGRNILYANSILNNAAANKLNDMIVKQYFDHINPEGIDPAEVVNNVGYTYIRVGENLALGNFPSDRNLVQAWMDSPGHRANILSGGYTEIGIAVGKGVWEQHETWFAVQTFGTPISACPTPNKRLRARINAASHDREKLQTDLLQYDAQRKQSEKGLNEFLIQADRLTREANEKNEAGNEKIKQGNEMYEQTESEEEARPYWDEGKQLQEEGKVLSDQARKAQESAQAARDRLTAIIDTYNMTVQHFNSLGVDLAKLTGDYNTQVESFNACADSFG